MDPDLDPYWPPPSSSGSGSGSVKNEYGSTTLVKTIEEVFSTQKKTLSSSKLILNNQLKDVRIFGTWLEHYKKMVSDSHPEAYYFPLTF